LRFENPPPLSTPLWYNGLESLKKISGRLGALPKEISLTCETLPHMKWVGEGSYFVQWRQDGGWNLK